MNLYENGVTEWFVAESESDAAKACREFNAAQGLPVGEDELDLDFVQAPDDRVLTMTIEECEPGGVRLRTVSKTAREWADSNPRGFLMTTEY